MRRNETPELSRRQIAADRRTASIAMLPRACWKKRSSPGLPEGVGSSVKDMNQSYWVLDPRSTIRFRLVGTSGDKPIHIRIGAFQYSAPARISISMRGSTSKLPSRLQLRRSFIGCQEGLDLMLKRLR